MRNILKNVVAVALVCALASGCSAASNRKVWLGLDRRDVLCDKPSYTQAYIASVQDVYCRVLGEIIAMKIEIFKREDAKHFIDTYGYFKLYPGCIDTTEVGFVVRPTTTAGVCEVVVTSDNYILAGRVAKDLFNRLAGKDLATPTTDRPLEPIVPGAPAEPALAPVPAATPAPAADKPAEPAATPSTPTPDTPAEQAAAPAPDAAAPAAPQQK